MVIFSLLWGLLKPLLSSPLFWLVAISLAIGFHYGKSGCRQQRVRPVRSVQYKVAEVTSGATIEVYVGPLERRTKTIWLKDISAPPQDDKCFEKSRVNLEKYAGKKIRNENGIVYGESGGCLNLEQIMSGMADTSSTNKEWIKQRNIAKKNKIGIWSVK